MGSKKIVKAQGTGLRNSPLYGTEQIVKALSTGYKTITQLAKELNVTTTTVYAYLDRVRAERKIETKKVRQGIRGPLADGFQIRAR